MSRSFLQDKAAVWLADATMHQSDSGDRAQHYGHRQLRER
jgi:hypothetical protein